VLITRWATASDHCEIGSGRRAPSSLLARAALRALLARHTDQVDWRIIRTQQGKPFLISPSGAAGPSVSVSHTGETVAVAMAREGSIGIDIERHRPRDFNALAAQAFGPTEQAEVAVHGEDAFFRIWTLREAIAKATGEGLALAANGRDLVYPRGSDPHRRVDCAGRTWDLTYLQIRGEYSLAAARTGAVTETWPPCWIDFADGDAGCADTPV